VTGEQQRFLDHSALVVAPRDRLVCAAIVRPDTRADLEPDIVVSALSPHDAEVLIDRTDPDVVLVESRALTSGHPWAGAGEPSVVDPTTRLRDLLESTRVRGIPSVLWWSDARTETPGLLPFERRFDFVTSVGGSEPSVDMAWSPGVQLARFGSLLDEGQRAARPAWHARWDQMPSRGERLAVERAMNGLETRPELWIDADITTAPAWIPPGYRADEVERIGSAALGEAYRARGLFIAERLTGAPQGSGVSVSTLRQLAAGSRVLSGPDEPLADAVGSWIDWAPDMERIPTIVADASLGARDTSDQRSLLRHLFLSLDTTASIAKLATLIGLRRVTPRRDVCVVAPLDEEAAPAALANSLAMQQHRPVEAVLVGGGAGTADRAVAELGAVGVRARWVPSHTLPGGPAALPAALTAAEWIWVWAPGTPYEPTFLIDAVIDGLATGAPRDAAVLRSHAVGAGRRPDVDMRGKAMYVD
jgi:hypothetical protein